MTSSVLARDPRKFFLGRMLKATAGFVLTRADLRRTIYQYAPAPRFVVALPDSRIEHAAAAPTGNG
jgi:hypothetical protein